MSAPLKVGNSGARVLELKEKLAKAGFLDPSDIKDGGDLFDENLKQAIQSLQALRGLDVDGICGPDTWAALQEAEWQLGSRHLYVTSPMLRGDDVGELQKLLGQLGFDAGREDGIFGPDTADALGEFQKHCHLAVDRICGADTVKALKQISVRAKGENVASVKEREKYRTHFLNKVDVLNKIDVFGAGLLSASKKDSGERKTLELLCTELSKAFEAIAGISFEPHIDNNPSTLAKAANDRQADVCLGFKLTPDSLFQTSYFATGTYESAGGKSLAGFLSQKVSEDISETKLFASQNNRLEVPNPLGMRTSLLKETKMWTIMSIFGPKEAIEAEIAEFSAIYVECLKTWTEI